jgi:DNA polymerase I-like protein with 3'-5' exonuclease and polymerase domains
MVSPVLPVSAGALPRVGRARRPEVLFVVEPSVIPQHLISGHAGINAKDAEKIIADLKAMGYTGDSALILAAAPPLTPEAYKSEKQTAEHLKAYKEVFDLEVSRLNPRVIVASGKCAARQVFGRAVKITEARGVPVQDEKRDGVVILPILSLTHVRRVPNLLHTYETDMRRLSALKSAGYALAAEGASGVGKKYRWCWDLREWLKNPPDLLCVDTETTGLKWYAEDTKILTVQLCRTPGEAISIPIDYGLLPLGPSYSRVKVVRQLKLLLESPKVKVIGHNFKFDVHFLREKLGINVANYYGDTILLMHALDENQISKSLDECVRLYVPEMAGYNDAYNADPEHQSKSRMDLFRPEKMLPYGAGDVDACLRLFQVLSPLLRKDVRAYNSYRRVTQPAMRMFCDAERPGLGIDPEEFTNFKRFLEERQAVTKEELLRALPRQIRQEYASTGVGLKFSRDALVRAWLFTHPAGLRLTPKVFTGTSTKEAPVPSVSAKDHLSYFADHPTVARLMDYSKVDKLLGTYMEGFRKYIHKGRVFPTYLLHATSTGRTASRDPNGQNLPKRGPLAKAYRKIFVAPPGYVFVESDLSQIELRVVAIMANDPTMLKIYKEKGDIHSATAARLMGLSLTAFQELSSDARKDARTKAKAVNFGFIYGMWWRKFKTYAKTDYGVDFTDKEAEQVRVLFFKTYANLSKWHEQVISFVKKNGYVRSLDGRVRHLPTVFSDDEGIRKQSERQAINSPVQSFANDLGLMAMTRINAEVPHEKVRVCGFVHDAIVSLVKREDAMWACKTIKHYMETNPLEEWFGLKLPIPIEADVSIGYNLSEMHELSPKWEMLVADKAVITADDIIRYVSDSPPQARKAAVRRTIQALRKNVQPRKLIRRS